MSTRQFGSYPSARYWRNLGAAVLIFLGTMLPVSSPAALFGPFGKDENEETFFEIADRKARLVGEIRDLQQRIADTSRRLGEVKLAEQAVSDRQNDLKKISDELAKIESDPKAQTRDSMLRAQNLAIKKAGAEQELRIAQGDLAGDSTATVQTKLATDQAALTQKLEDQQTLEKKILQMRTPAQEFKTTLSMAFALLIAFVIGGFFWIAYIDGQVRSAIFSGQAGIQFITLFSLVIAIILFGITGILEGKELSALLGGLSGYILGRSTQGSEPRGAGPTGASGNSVEVPKESGTAAE